VFLSLHQNHSLWTHSWATPDLVNQDIWNGIHKSTVITSHPHYFHALKFDNHQIKEWRPLH
jgi:hypothetical protein